MPSRTKQADAGPFDPASSTLFVFEPPRFDPATGELDLPYRLDRADTEPLCFVERFRFPIPTNTDTDAGELARAVRLLHWAAGVSYYKAACPPGIAFEGEPPTAAEAAFLQRLYFHGLGEFAAVNAMSLDGRIPFAPGAEHDDPPGTTDAPRPGLDARWLVPVGGGKDSMVTATLLRNAGARVTPFVLGANPVVLSAAEHLASSGTNPVLRAQRRIDPALLDLNARGALNGHVPVTAIVSLAAVLGALLSGHDAVAMSNERSANIGEVVGKDGRDVNHQHSKSLAFERDLRAALTGMPVSYQSVLRPLSELSICALFASMPEHHAAFTSCNANFRISPGGASPRRWCNDCPKCRFVSLALAPWLEPATLDAIFSESPLHNPDQLDGYRALLGAPGTIKPFECVGQIDECRAAAELLARDPRHADAPPVRWYTEHLRGSLVDHDERIDRVLTPSDDHELSADIAALVADPARRVCEIGGSRAAR